MNINQSSLPPSHRFFFKTMYDGIEEALMEEISDEETVLPHYEGKIVARVESVA